MGICYFLIRRDTRTVYELGKAWFLCHVFGEADASLPICVAEGDVDTITSLILAAERGDLDLCCDVSLHRRPDAEEEHYGYWRAVAADVVDWSEGQPIEFHSEHSGLYEDIFMSARERDGDSMRVRCFKTGSRHDPCSADPGMRVLAQRRRSDACFRRGIAWFSSPINALDRFVLDRGRSAR